MKSFERRIQVARAIQRELGQIIQSGEIKDDRLATFVSIVDVDLNANMSVARVSYSVMATEGEDTFAIEQGTQAALDNFASKLSGIICRKINLRYAPRLVFTSSQSLKKGSDIIDLINKISTDDE